jgi:hypothetical protein
MSISISSVKVVPSLTRYTIVPMDTVVWSFFLLLKYSKMYYSPMSQAKRPFDSQEMIKSTI